MTATEICRWCEEPIRYRHDNLPESWVHVSNGSRWCDLDDDASQAADPMPEDVAR